MIRKLYSITFLSISILSILSVNALAASFTLSPSSGEYISNCIYETEILINTDSQKSNSADITISYDPAAIEILDQNPNLNGIQISTGDAYEDYVYHSVDTITGTIKLVAASYTTPLSGSETFSIIKFKNIDATGPSGFQIFYTGASATTDSNIADNISSTDILTSVTNASYTFTTGECEPDTDPPHIIFVYPNNNQETVEEDAEIIIRVTDAIAGINIDTLQIFLNDITYDINNLEVTYNGDINEYEIHLIPSELIPQGMASTLRIIIKDFEGNEKTEAIVFNKPIETLPSTGEELTPNTIETIQQNVEEFLGSSPAKAVELIPAIAPILLTTASYSRFNLYAIAWLKSRKKKKKWGLIFDQSKKIPIPFAIVRVYKDGRFYKQEITNTKGQYGLILTKGDYTLELSHPDYTNITRILKVTDPEIKFGEDIGLDVATSYEDNNVLRKIITKYKQNRFLINTVLFVSGLWFSLIALFVHRILFNYIVVLFYILQLVYIIIKLQGKNDWGYIYDSVNNTRIPGAIIKIFSAKENRQIEVMMSDTRGRYTFKTTPNDTYLLMVSSAGYAFPSINEPTGHLSINDAGIKMLKVNKIVKGNISQNVPMDKIASTTNKKGDTLYSPFSA